MHRQIVGCILHSRVTGDQSVEPDDATFSAEGDKRNLLFIARFKANGGSSGYIQMPAKSLYTIEFQVSIGFEEVIVRPHLNGTVPRVAHCQRDALFGRIESHIALSQQHTTHRGHGFAIFHFKKN